MLVYSKLNKISIGEIKKIKNQDLYLNQSNHLTMGFFGWTPTHVKSYHVVGYHLPKFEIQ
jgi:hypothetical protein